MPNTVDFYLSKGFDRPMAEYFARGRKRLAAVAPQHDFTLLLTYEDGEQRVYDMKPLLDYLDDTCAVSWDIDPNVDSNVFWNNKVDICPDGCYVDSVPLSEYKAVS